MVHNVLLQWPQRSLQRIRSAQVRCRTANICLVAARLIESVQSRAHECAALHNDVACGECSNRAQASCPVDQTNQGRLCG